MFLTVNIRVFSLDVSQIFKIWLAAEIFLLALRLPGKKEIAPFGGIGRKYSLYIYLFHYLIGTLLLDVLTALAAPGWIRSWILPPVVILLSVLLAAAI